MKNLKKPFTSLFMLCLTLGMITSASAGFLDALNQNKDGKLPKATNKGEIPFYLPSYVKQNKIPPGIFETEGYVTFIHNPYNGQMHQRLIIVHEKKNGPADTAIRIKIKDAQGLQKGQRYRFTIKAESVKMNPQSTQQALELLKFTLME